MILMLMETMLSIYMTLISFFIFIISYKQTGKILFGLFLFAIFTVSAVKTYSFIRVCMSYSKVDKKKGVPRYFLTSQVSTFFAIILVGILLDETFKFYVYFLLEFFICGPFFIIRHIYEFLKKWSELP